MKVPDQWRFRRADIDAWIDKKEDPNAFREELATPRLAAWALAAHREGAGRELARFDLTCAVSAAHPPWMWCVCEGSALSLMPDQNVTVRKLQGDESCSEFRARFLLPLPSLVEGMSDQLPERVRTELHGIITETAQAYAEEVVH